MEIKNKAQIVQTTLIDDQKKVPRKEEKYLMITYKFAFDIFFDYLRFISVQLRGKNFCKLPLVTRDF